MLLGELHSLDAGKAMEAVKSPIVTLVLKNQNPIGFHTNFNLILSFLL